MFENVDGQRTNNGVIGILLAHLGAFGSGKLKSVTDDNREDVNVSAEQGRRHKNESNC